MRERLAASNNPNLLLMNYDLERREVGDLCVVPKQFFVLDIIEERKPLGPNARRAGWIGCNILLNQIPEAGKVFIVRDRQPQPKETVLHQWHKTLFLRQRGEAARGWLIEVLRCVDEIGRVEFDINEVYRFERRLSELYPNNLHVRQKIRQQLQILRDQGFLEFLSPGRYRLTSTRY